MSCVSDIQRALLLRDTFSAAEPLELLDLVFEGRTLLPAECSALELDKSLTPIALAFVAGAFDRGMLESEWLAWQAPQADPQLQAIVRNLWHQLVIPAFTDRYTGHARQLPGKQEVRAFRSLRML